ncbi:MAG: hypothetical protein A3B68_04200 [Candidatus Melainabacteria bacterium RIFCSPHIGHO2_02_FULL_34_12]|nr:MAG: hypothetical protein A3B68_04200 [Candidatus Melainabacteria bacterium RIFCSPHIGHO2_02_FULL_34_12]
MLGRIEAKILKTSQAFFYYLAWMVQYLISLSFFRIKIEGRENLPKKGKFILAANHQNFFDGFLLAYASGPYRKISFLIAKRALKTKWSQIVARLIGSVLINEGAEEYQQALKKLNRILTHGGAIGIFPEGNVTNNKIPTRFKGGVAKLSYDSNTEVIPVYLTGTYEARYFKYWLKRPEILIRIGKPIELYKHVKNGNNLDEAAAFLREKTIELMNLNEQQNIVKLNPGESDKLVNIHNPAKNDFLGKAQNFNKI